MTTLTRKLAALLLTLAGGQLALASEASAAPGLLGGLLAPRQPGAPATGAAPTLREVEQKLLALHYDVGPEDGIADDQTASAIMAFQKVHRLERTGTLTDPLARQIMASHGTPPPLVVDGEPNRVEVSLARQVLFLYKGGTLTKIVPVASGTSKTPTPTGSFRFYRYDPGWHTSRLGRLYNAEYFVGGYAIHGSLSVPAQPASHGCIRIPMSAAEWFPAEVSIGMQVVILEN